MQSNGSSDEEVEDFNEGMGGRGMLGVTMDDDGLIQLEHQFTDKIFEFKRSDLDEVIEVLVEFREFLIKEGN